MCDWQSVFLGVGVCGCLRVDPEWTPSASGPPVRWTRGPRVDPRLDPESTRVSKGPVTSSETVRTSSPSYTHHHTHTPQCHTIHTLHTLHRIHTLHRSKQLHRHTPPHTQKQSWQMRPSQEPLTCLIKTVSTPKKRSPLQSYVHQSLPLGHSPTSIFLQTKWKCQF